MASKTKKTNESKPAAVILLKFENMNLDLTIVCI